MSYVLRVSRFGVDKATSVHPTFEDALDRAKELHKVYKDHAVDIYNDSTADAYLKDGEEVFNDGLTDEERDALWEETT